MVDLGTNKKVSTPLPAVVGQADLKRVLLALAVEPGLSGALLRGEKGTAKSTSVRALADLLPEQTVVADCPYGCPPTNATGTTDDYSGSDQCASCRDREDPPVETRPAPLVTLPLGATRDRVVGTLSVSDALDGDAEFDPGLLARANRGVLYVDEVNLLPDHLIDVLLDAAAMGTNHVERDGVSVAHPAEFTLIGTMNPEEGELRPQLRDRFDLCVNVTGSDEIDERVEILDRVVDDDGGQDLRAEFEAETAALRERVHNARDRRPAIPEEFKRDIAELCRDADVDGHRADFAIARAARAFAALDGRPKVIESDVADAAEYGLSHRLQSRPFEEPVDPEEVVDDHFGDDTAEGDRDPEADTDPLGDGDGTDTEDPDPDGSDPDQGSGADGESVGGESRSDTNGGGNSDDRGTDGPDRDRSGAPDGSRSEDADDTERPPSNAAAADRGDGADEEVPDSDGDDEAAPIPPGRARAGVADAAAPEVPSPTSRSDATGEGDGRHAAAPSPEGRGPTVRTERAEETESVDPVSTVRAAAQNGRSRPADTDLRRAVRADDADTLTVFVTDASASMAPAMRAAKGVALELLRDAYTERDEVALVSFGGDGAEVLLPPTTSVTLAARQLKELPTADRTPLPDGLNKAATLIERKGSAAATVVLVSDGRANVAKGSPTAATRQAAERVAETDASVLVVDAGESRAGVLDIVCETTDARRTPLAALSADAVLGDE
ncbi:VWA domain-containing protein [Halorubrum ezzemoulense]|uniref:VWA domain-containing protein n=1 Tax=Halorubrum ezzemoulense TaxID=337243 RepID=UPI00232E0825|nr:VWA domain-containing protein [Halorubrum ezzemoulense]MDB2239352.1 VWA domain-containing protein [Halorubrum ezzemoulense]